MRSLRTIRDLAGGRLPPLTRRALVAVLFVFVATLVLVRPTDGGLPAVESLRAGVRWVAKGDGATEAAVLLDPSVAYMPSKLISAPEATMSGPKTSEETPFGHLERRLHIDPIKGDEPLLRVAEPTAPTLASAVPLSQAEPFITFGRANMTQSSLAPRQGSFEVLPINGAFKPLISGILPPLDIKKGNFSDKNKGNDPLVAIFEATIGVDSLGLQGLPALVRSSGDRSVDRGIMTWAAGVPWAKHLPPGTYRLTVVP
jgi:hypothetical protein